MASQSGKSLPPPPQYGTGLMDRMNIFLHVFKAGRFIIRRWWVFLLSLLVTGGVAGYKAYTLPDQYRATAYLAPTPRDVIGDDTIVEPINVEREKEIIFSKDVENKITEWVLSQYPDSPAPVFRRTIIMGQSFTFKLIVTATEPVFAENMVNEWAKHVIDTKERLAKNQHVQRISETSKTVKDAQFILGEITENISDFLQKNPNVDAVKGIGGYSDLSDKKVALETEIDRKQISLDFLMGTASSNAFKRFLDIYAGKNTDDITASDDSLNIFSQAEIQHSLDLMKELEKSQSDVEKWAATLKPAHPYMKEMQDQVALAKQKFDQQALSFNTQLKAKEKSLSTEIGVLKTRLANVSLQMEQLRPRQKQYEDLVREQYNQQEIIKTLKEEEFLVKSRKPILNLSILNAGRNEGRIGPNRPLIVAAGVIGGFMLAGVLVFFLCKLDDRLELAEDIERELQEHVLGQIPKVDNSLVKKGRFLITDLGLHDMFCESLRGVRSAFKYYNHSEKKIRSIVVTSAVPGDGKSTITVNFGATMAMAGNRVLLIDADLRRGSVNEFFGFKRTGGLSDVLSGRVHWLDVTRETPIPNLEIITTGKLPMNPGELLSSPVIPDLIRQAEQEYDYVIIDCPPLIAIDDAYSVFEHVDTGLFVIRAGQSSLRFIKSALHELDKRGQGILGIILNGITTADPSYYYAKYYHSYYNKDLPQSAVESSSVYQPAQNMPEPKRKKPRKADTLSVSSQSLPDPQAKQPEVAANGHSNGTPNQNASAAPNGKIVRYKARRAYRKGNSSGQPT